jgi:hypothetical protein
MSRLGRLDVVAFRDSLWDEDFCGVVHIVGDDDEPPVTLTLGFADRAASVLIRVGRDVDARSPVEKVGCGLGVVHGGAGPTARIGHSGEDPGFSSRAWAYRATGEPIAVLST